MAFYKLCSYSAFSKFARCTICEDVKRTVTATAFYSRERRCSKNRRISTATSDHYNHVRRYVEKLCQEKADLDAKSLSAVLSKEERQRFIRIQPAVEAMLEIQTLERDLGELTALLADERDEEMKTLIVDDQTTINAQISTLQTHLESLLLPPEPADNNDVILEVSAGVGGTEAGIFAAQLFKLYQRFSNFSGWSMVTVEKRAMGDTADEAFNKVQAIISGENVYHLLKYESGVHRVQRVPATERSGRMHTSTAVVSILPKAEKVNIDVRSSDLKWNVFKSGGRGGQSVNTTESAVRVIYIPTGHAVECQQTRSQLRNKELALEILRSQLYDKQLAEQEAQHSSQRKLQIGGAGRNEKIRTYNFQQDRITDHRVKKTVTGISSYLEGGVKFEQFLQELMEVSRREKLQEVLVVANKD